MWNVECGMENLKFCNPQSAIRNPFALTAVAERRCRKPLQGPKTFMMEETGRIRKGAAFFLSAMPQAGPILGDPPENA